MTIAQIFETHFTIIRASRDAVTSSHADFSHDTAAALDVTQCCLVDDTHLETVVAVGRKVSIMERVK